MRDPDILAIQRKRRQQGRCVACGKREERYRGRPATLCGGCVLTLAFCPGCESVYERKPGLTQGQASQYCTACNTAHKRADGRSWSGYIADIRARRRRLLPELIKRYRKPGVSQAKAGAALGLTRAQTDQIIRDARMHGEWPEGLRRRAHHGEHRSDQGHER